MIDPGPGQAMPFSGLDRPNAVRDCRDGQQTTVSPLMQTAEPAFDTQGMQLQAHRQCTGQWRRPQGEQLLIALQQIR
ncbi:hypothetical protein D3C86_1700310 [compost metagenome]